jgi:hypothetical protein
VAALRDTTRQQDLQGVSVRLAPALRCVQQWRPCHRLRTAGTAARVTHRSTRAGGGIIEEELFCAIVFISQIYVAALIGDTYPGGEPTEPMRQACTRAVASSGVEADVFRMFV